MNTELFCRIVLVPWPLKPLTVVAYYVLTKCFVKPDTPLLGPHYARWVDWFVKGEPLFLQDEVVVNLHLLPRELEKKVISCLLSPSCGILTNKTRDDARAFVRRGLDPYGPEPAAGWVKPWESLLGGTLSFCHPLDALQLSAAFLGHLLFQEPFSPSAREIEKRVFTETDKLPEPLEIDFNKPLVRVSLRSPIKSRAPFGFSAREERTLAYSRVLKLTTRRIGIVIGGPPGRGKSTFASSLASAMRRAVSSYKTMLSEKTRSRVRVEIAYVPLDVATRVIPVMPSGKEWKGRLVARKKRPWDRALVQKAVTTMESKLQNANVVVADLPGKITPFTRQLSASARYGIIICRRKVELLAWKRYFVEVGIEPVAVIKSGAPTSGIWLYTENRVPIVGSIRQPKRFLRADDRCVRDLAAILLLGVFPTWFRGGF